MNGRRRNPFFRNELGRKICAVVSLFGYLLAALGIPVPTLNAKPASGPAFPCQQRGCGCSTFEQWLASCCCFTPAERQAWVERQREESPPTEVSRPEKTEEPACSCCQGEGGAAPGTGSCCSNKTEVKKEPGSPAVPKPTRPCCQHQAEPGDPKKADAKAKQMDSPISTVQQLSGMTSLQCQGLATMWMTTGAVMAGPAHVVWRNFYPAMEWLPSLISDPFFISSLPVEPPPRG